MSKVKVCRECQYFHNPHPEMELECHDTFQCTHKNFSKTHIITGELVYVICSRARSDKMNPGCGPSGLLFKAKIETNIHLLKPNAVEG